MADYYNRGRSDSVENREWYDFKGYCPVHIGDVLKSGRYEIWHKLGHGGYATVWLAHDRQTSKNVALKIECGLEVQPSLLEKTKEHIWLSQIRRLAVPPDEQQFLDFFPEVLDAFIHKSGNGWHHCLVTTLVGPSIDAWSKRGKRLTQLNAKKAALQLAKSVAFLHRHGICHGDLSAKNVLLEVPGIDQWTKEEIYQRLGAPHCDAVTRVDGQPLNLNMSPRYVVEAAGLETLHINYLSCNIKIIDFGVAFYFNALPTTPSQLLKPLQLQTPPAFLSPEAMFEPASGGPATDNWALIIVIFMIRSGKYLFPEIPNENITATRQIINTIGRLPTKWKSYGFDESTNELIKNPKDLTFWHSVWSDGDGKDILPKLIKRIIAEREGSNLSGNGVFDNRPEGLSLNFGRGLKITNSERLNPPKGFLLGFRSGTTADYKAHIMRLKGAKKISSIEAESLFSLMSRVLIYNPQTRLTAEEIIQHLWFTTEHPYSD